MGISIGQRVQFLHQINFEVAGREGGCRRNLCTEARRRQATQSTGMCGPCLDADFKSGLREGTYGTIRKLNIA